MRAIAGILMLVSILATNVQSQGKPKISCVCDRRRCSCSGRQLLIKKLKDSKPFEPVTKELAKLSCLSPACPESKQSHSCVCTYQI